MRCGQKAMQGDEVRRGSLFGLVDAVVVDDR